MTDDKSKPSGDELPSWNAKKADIRKDARLLGIPERGQTLKKSRYCTHGNVWGRCPHGC